MTTQRIAIIGTGNVGGALGRRMTMAGMPITFGVREGSEIDGLLAACQGRARAVSPAEAASDADVVFLAVPAKAAVEVAESLGALDGTTIVDCTNPVKWDDGPVWDPPAEGSVAAAIAKALPKTHVVKAFNTFGAEFHANPRLQDHHVVDVQIAGDDDDAKQSVANVARAAGFEPIDVGPLRNAAALENLAILWIHLATTGEKRRDHAFKLLGRRGPR